MYESFSVEWQGWFTSSDGLWSQSRRWAFALLPEEVQSVGIACGSFLSGSSTCLGLCWSHLRTVSLALCLADAVTYLCCQASGSLVILISARAFWPLCEQRLCEFLWLWIHWVPELVRCLPAVSSATMQNVNFIHPPHQPTCVFKDISWHSLHNRESLLEVFLYSFSLFSNRTHSGSSAVGRFLLELLSWKQGVLYHVSQMHFLSSLSRFQLLLQSNIQKGFLADFQSAPDSLTFVNYFCVAEHLLKDFSCSLMGMLFYYLTLFFFP